MITQNKIGIYFFRSLYSQSACSLSVGKLSDYLINKGYNTNLGVLKLNDYSFNMEYLNTLNENDIIVYKTNYKDFEYGIRFFKNYLDGKNRRFYLCGTYGVLNKGRILKKYSFITDIINMENSSEIDSVFPKTGIALKKDTLVWGIDREIEYKENVAYINLEASSGCIYNCAFCHINIMKYGKSTKNIDALVNEIDYLVNKMNKKYLIFNDSIFWKTKNDNIRVSDLVSKIKNKNIKFNFMIYLSIANRIPVDILDMLKEIGLIRVFFGVENISVDFQEANNKYISENETVSFMNTVKEKNISYHIGFILFFPYTKYDDLLANLKFLWQIKKLFRIGILVEKMRILPNSKDTNLLYEDNYIIDQAYNYRIFDQRVEACYNLINSYFSKINIRSFEQFFTGIDIAITILVNKNKKNSYVNLINCYYNILSHANDKLYSLLENMFKNLKYSNTDIENIRDLYSIAELNYIKFMNELKKNDFDIFNMIPHGKEDLNS